MGQDSASGAIVIYELALQSFSSIGDRASGVDLAVSRNISDVTSLSEAQIWYHTQRERVGVFMVLELVSTARNTGNTHPFH